MSMIVTKTLTNGVTAPAAFARVTHAGVIWKGKDDGGNTVRQLQFSLQWFLNAAVAQHGNPERRVPLCADELRQCAYAGGDIDAEAYVHLKTLPEFAGAVDV